MVGFQPNFTDSQFQNFIQKPEHFSTLMSKLFVSLASKGGLSTMIEFLEEYIILVLLVWCLYHRKNLQFHLP